MNEQTVDGRAPLNSVVNVKNQPVQNGPALGALARHLATVREKNRQAVEGKAESHNDTTG